MKVKITVEGPRACGKTYLLRYLEQSLKVVYKTIKSEGGSYNELTKDGIPMETYSVELDL